MRHSSLVRPLVLGLGGISLLVWGFLSVSANAILPRIDHLPTSGQLFAWSAQARMVAASVNATLPLPALPMADMCALHDAQASPNGQWIVVQINCEAGAYSQLLQASTGQLLTPTAWGNTENWFAGWAADNTAWFIADDFVTTRAFRIDPAQQKTWEISVPEGTYGLSLSPDGTRLLYSATQGLGFGSQTWVADADGRNPVLLFTEPVHITAFAQWSPTGAQLAYMRMPDSVVPFPLGELWLADGAGRNPVFVAAADSGHGYRPVWSPDGRALAFVGRENPHDVWADQLAEPLESNLYLVDAQTHGVTQLTHFAPAQVLQPLWLDPTTLIFSAHAQGQTNLWRADLTTRQTQQLTFNGTARFPVWLPNPIATPDRRP